MDQSLPKIFEAEGVLEIVGGNQPFLLNDPSSVWLVEWGQVEIFSVRVENNEPVGSRFHFCSTASGQMLFGMDLNAYGMGRGFLAVGLVNTRLRRLPLARLKEAAAQTRLEILDLIDQWVHSLSAGVARNLYTRAELVIEHENPQQVGRSINFRSRKGIYWIEHDQGELMFLGMEDVPSDGKARYFPVTEDTWLETLQPTKITGHRTANLATDEALWLALEFLYEVIFKCERVNKRLAEVDELNRMRDRFTESSKAADRALDELASVFGKREAVESQQVDDALYNACDKVARSRGITLRPPRELLKREPLRDPLGTILKTSGIRSRKVSLKGAWWKEDSVSYLVFLRERLTPLAAIKNAGDGYVLVDPASGQTVPLTADVAATLEDYGHEFYRTFGTKAVTFWKALAFGAHGLGQDLKTLVLMGVAGGLLGMLPAMATARLFDSIIPSARQDQLWQITTGLILIALSLGIFEFTRGLAQLRIEGKMDNNIQAAVIDRLFGLPTTFFRHFSSGDLAERANGISQIRQSLSATVGSTLISNIFASFNIFLLYYYDAYLATVALGLIVFTVLFVILCSALQVRYQREVMMYQGRISSQIFQLLNGIGKLRVAGAEGLAFSKWATLFAAQKRVAVKSRGATNMMLVFNAGFPIITTAIFFWVVVYGGKSQQMSPGEFLAFFTAFTVTLGSMLATASSLIGALNIVPLAERVRPLLQTPTETTDTKIHPGELSGRIELSGISYRYSPDGPLVLKNVSLEIKPREFLAIVGPSGSGKSTLLRLLLGFDQPEAGAVLYDGQELSELDLRVVRRQIGTVLQTSKLMAGSIMSNILGSLPLTQDDAWEAARMAGLEEDIKRLPMGMHTMVSTSSSVFSGGQQQRLIIARAIACKPKILLFDEATSALDNRTQALVSESLESLHTTRIVVAHRLSTIVNADRICVVDKGQIVQIGTYQELLNQPGTFQDLARRQIVEET